MTEWFRTSNIPGIETLPITRHVGELLNEADGDDSVAVAQQTAKAVVFAASALETKINALMTAMGATENGLAPGEYNGVQSIPADS